MRAIAILVNQVMEDHDLLSVVDPAFRTKVKLEVERDALEL
ncbi:MAG TPA: hypothetical protein VFV34_23965 [Blastocatellia bacterium]|nr:hypothetical protein [Blastocatellia bacterium]